MSAIDVAQYILNQAEPMPAMKLQKLVYYSQAWSLVWDDRRLFDESIEAWKNGPVIPSLWRRNAYQYIVDDVGGDPSVLDRDARETILGVLRFYSSKTAEQLSDLTHVEEPWQMAREGLRPDDRGKTIIKRVWMKQYYGALWQQRSRR